MATPENLRREGSAPGETRRDWSGWMRSWYDSFRLSDAQAAAIRWLAAQPEGPRRILVISEEWSSDCRRDVPMLQRLAEAGGLELRIFRRDGERFGQSQQPSLAEAPDSNADLMAEFLNEKRGQTWQSIPVAVFYTADLRYLYHYVEYPRIYDKDRLVYGHIRVPRPGETPEATARARGAGVHGAPGVAVLPDLGLGRGRRDPLGAPPAGRPRPARLTEIRPIPRRPGSGRRVGPQAQKASTVRRSSG